MKKLSLSEIAEEEKKQQTQQEAIAAQKKERFVKLTFLIATEGTETEPNYFNALKSELEHSNRFNIDIAVQGKGKSTTALVNKIIRQIKYNNQEYDRLWAVFDKDDFNDFDAAIKLASENGISCAWSNERLVSISWKKPFAKLSTKTIPMLYTTTPKAPLIFTPTRKISGMRSKPLKEQRYSKRSF